LEYHQTTLPFQVSHETRYAQFGRYTHQYMYMVWAWGCVCVLFLLASYGIRRARENVSGTLFLHNALLRVGRKFTLLYSDILTKKT
jgi:hypothetical protein